jgi:hypothetical protein
MNQPDTKRGTRAPWGALIAGLALTASTGCGFDVWDDVFGAPDEDAGAACESVWCSADGTPPGTPGGALPGVSLPSDDPAAAPGGGGGGPRSTPTPGTFGGGCDEVQACGGETTCSPELPGGMCVGGGCEGRAFGAFCDGESPESGYCVRGVTGAACMPTCVMNADCREGYVCSTTTGGANEMGYGFCKPSCAYTGCEPGFACMPSGVCSCEHEGEVAAQQVRRLDLGAVEVGRSSFEWVEFTVPDDGISLTVTLTPRDAAIAPVFVRLMAPGGVPLYEFFDEESSPMTFTHTTYTKATMIYPNAPELDLPPGTYQVQIGAAGETTIDVEVFVKTGRAPDQGGRMPLNLWFTKTTYMDAQKASTDETFQAALEAVKETYAEAGIELAPITYRDVPEPLASRYAVVDGAATADSVTAQVLGDARTEGVNVVLVDQWVGGGGAITLGQAAGIPGPPGRADTRTLGVLVSMATTFRGRQGADHLASIISHEIGHYMGLYHTTEADGAQFDPLSDTPECPPSRDANGDGNLSAAECGVGANNLMFWQASAQPAEQTLSPAQDWVLLRNPMVLP